MLYLYLPRCLFNFMAVCFHLQCLIYFLRYFQNSKDLDLVFSSSLANSVSFQVKKVDYIGAFDLSFYKKVSYLKILNKIR